MLTYYAARAYIQLIIFAEILGFLLGVSAILVILWLGYQWIGDSSLFYLVAAIGLLGFPFQLLLERGNVDVFLFILCFALAYLSVFVYRFRFVAAALGFLVAYLLVAIKIYPVVGIVCWISLRIYQRRFSFVFDCSVLAGSFFGFVSELNWLLHSVGVAAAPGQGVFSHGLLMSTSPRFVGTNFGPLGVSLYLIIFSLIAIFPLVLGASWV
jgi:hypothetical protein